MVTTVTPPLGVAALSTAPQKEIATSIQNVDAQQLQASGTMSTALLFFLVIVIHSLSYFQLFPYKLISLSVLTLFSQLYHILVYFHFIIGPM